MTIDEMSGLPSKLTIPGVSESSSFQQNFFFYSSYAGNNEVYQNQSSGAYVFRPNSSLVGITSQATTKIYKGTILDVSPLLGNLSLIGKRVLEWPLWNYYEVCKYLLIVSGPHLWFHQKICTHNTGWSSYQVLQ